MIRLQNIDANIKPSRTFGRGKYLIGRSPSCDLEIPDKTMSRQHAMLEVVDDERIYLTDLDSRNGTSVNGERIMNTIRLKPEDVIMFGDVRFRVSPVDDDTFQGDTIPVSEVTVERAKAPAEPDTPTDEIPILRNPGGGIVPVLSHLGQVQIDPANSDAVVRSLVEGVKLGFAGQHAAIVTIDRSGNPSSFITESGTFSIDSRPGFLAAEVLNRAMNSRELIYELVNESGQATAVEDARSAVLIVPLQYNERLTGFLYVDRNIDDQDSAREVFQDIDGISLGSMARVIASKLANLQDLSS